MSIVHILKFYMYISHFLADVEGLTVLILDFVRSAFNIVSIFVLGVPHLGGTAPEPGQPGSGEEGASPGACTVRLPA